MSALLAWLAGWRRDPDGWFVRAKRPADPDLSGRPDLGFTEEACIAVRGARIAVAIDFKEPL